MRHYAALSAGLLAGWFLWGTATLAGDSDRESATIELVSVRVRTTKAGGAAWDAADGKPDLKVTVERKARPAGDKFTTKVVPDTFEAKFNVKTIEVKEGDEVEVTVADEDAVSDDRVGRLNVRVTQKMLRKGEADWSFDEVLSLKVEFVD